MGPGCCGPSCEALRGLIHWEIPLEEAIRAAGQCDEQPGPPVVFDASTARSVLERCIAGDLPVCDLPRWAGAVHTLERVELADRERDLLAQFLFEIDTPELFDPVTASLCRKWKARLA
ncbi:hypothetical protein ACFPA8_26795 [Streptomyces ovatisporus]|uniref:Uncharacterized protein n=1 Tax=Streptomyces ovatisporus TaxID=1128682 RepID=A0ABV9AH36_9ACTN